MKKKNGSLIVVFLYFIFSVMSFSANVGINSLVIVANIKKGVDGLAYGLQIVLVLVSVLVLIWKLIEGVNGQNDLGTYIKALILISVMLTIAAKIPDIVNFFSSGATFQIAQETFKIIT